MRNLVSGRTAEETRKEVAYIGWCELRNAIRDQERALAQLRKQLNCGSKTVIRNRQRVEVALTEEERVALIREIELVDDWIGRLRRERRENGRIAGDLIPEIDREKVTA